MYLVKANIVYITETKMTRKKINEGGQEGGLEVKDAREQEF